MSKSLIILAALLISAVAVSAEVADKNQPIKQPDQATKGQNSDAKHGSAALVEANPTIEKQAHDSVPGHPDEKLQIDRDIRDFTGQLAKYTLALVAATIVLGLIAIWQGYLLREEFLVSHRAKLIVRNVAINHLVAGEGTGQININWVVANVGSSAAQIIEKSTRFWDNKDGDIVQTLLPNDVYAVPSAFAKKIESGESKFIDITDTSVVEEFYFRQAFMDTKTEHGQDSHDPGLTFIGYITYIDAAKRKRKTAFRRQYSFTTRRFTAVDDPDYEYQE